VSKYAYPVSKNGLRTQSLRHYVRLRHATVSALKPRHGDLW